MSETTASRKVTVVSPQGLHLRTADRFVKTASQFDSRIEVIKDGQRAEARSIMDILSLGADKGARLYIEATGHDAQQALDVLARLIESDFADEETHANEETHAEEETQKSSDQDQENV